MTQDQALKILKTGANVFLTGEPGSGKTYLVNQYIEYLREHQIPVAVTASTGIAATHLGGRTIHSFSGVGIRKSLTEVTLAKLKSKRSLVSRVQNAQVLIIDEISMLEAQVLSVVDQALRALRENEAAFGGLQVVLVGDFFQLPPVAPGDEKAAFAFESPSWQTAQLVTCYLTEQYRQEDDLFSTLLAALRKNESDDQHVDLLRERRMQVTTTQEVTRLYSHNVDVDAVNLERLEELPGKVRRFEMRSYGKKGLVEQLKKGCLSPELLVLKKGARVMFTKNNFEHGFVNGTLGEVVGFEDGQPVVKTLEGYEIVVAPMEWSIEENNKPVARIVQLPLRLAWAITIHKSQGMTLDAAVMDLSQVFEYGQGYVAISRVKSLDGLYLLGMNRQALEVHPEILSVDGLFRAYSKKAEERLRQYSDEKMQDKYEAFILRCGGNMEKVAPEKKLTTYDKTLALFEKGMDVEEIASQRELTEKTIVRHLERLKQEGRLSREALERVVGDELLKVAPEIVAVFQEQEEQYLKPVYEYFDGAYSYDELRLVRLLV